MKKVNEILNDDDIQYMVIVLSYAIYTLLIINIEGI